MKFLIIKCKHIVMLALCTMMVLSHSALAGKKTSVKLANTGFTINGTMTDINDVEGDSLILIDQGWSILLLAQSSLDDKTTINTCFTNNPTYMTMLRNTDFDSHIIAFIRNSECSNIITAKSSIYAPEAK